MDLVGSGAVGRELALPEEAVAKDQDAPDPEMCEEAEEDEPSPHEVGRVTTPWDNATFAAGGCWSSEALLDSPPASPPPASPPAPWPPDWYVRQPGEEDDDAFTRGFMQRVHLRAIEASRQATDARRAAREAKKAEEAAWAQEAQAEDEAFEAELARKMDAGESTHVQGFSRSPEEVARMDALWPALLAFRAEDDGKEPSKELLSG